MLAERSEALRHGTGVQHLNPTTEDFKFFLIFYPTALPDLLRNEDLGEVRQEGWCVIGLPNGRKEKEADLNGYNSISLIMSVCNFFAVKS